MCWRFVARDEVIRGEAMPEAKRYRDKVAEFERLSEESENEVLRESYRALAKEYRKLAKYYEDRKQRGK